MSRGWLAVALFLSLGVNLGLVGTAMARRHAPDRQPGARSAEEVARVSERRAEEGRPGLGDERALESTGFDVGGRLADRLELEGERRERFQAALRRALGDVETARGEITGVRREMRREVAARDTDRARIDALLSELEAAEAKLNRAFVDGILEAKSVLGPEKSREFLRLVAELGLARPPIESRRLGAGAPFSPRRLGEERRQETEPAPAPTKASAAVP